MVRTRTWHARQAPVGPATRLSNFREVKPPHCPMDAVAASRPIGSGCETATRSGAVRKAYGYAGRCAIPIRRPFRFRWPAWRALRPRRPAWRCPVLRWARGDRPRFAVEAWLARRADPVSPDSQGCAFGYAYLTVLSLSQSMIGPRAAVSAGPGARPLRPPGQSRCRARSSFPGLGASRGARRARATAHGQPGPRQRNAR